MWFLFGEDSSSSGCLGWATLFHCGTSWAFHIIILLKSNPLYLFVVVVLLFAMVLNQSLDYAYLYGTKFPTLWQLKTKI